MDFRTNVSEVKDFEKCQTFWFFARVLMRSPRQTPGYLTLGTLVHRDMEDVQLGRPHVPIETRYQEAVGASQADWDPDTLRMAEILTPRLLYFYEHHLGPLGEVLYVEEVLEAPLAPGITLFGRLDALARWAKRLFTREVKTRDPNTKQSTFSAVKEVDLQQQLYGHLVRENFSGDPFGGVQLITFAKAPPTRRENGRSGKLVPRNPEECVHVEYLPIAGSDILKAVDDTAEVARDILTLRTRLGATHSSAPFGDSGYAGAPFGPQLVRRSRSGVACGMGNRLCPYFGTCWRKVPITDDTMYASRNPLADYERVEAEKETV